MTLGLLNILKRNILNTNSFQADSKALTNSWLKLKYEMPQYLVMFKEENFIPLFARILSHVWLYVLFWFDETLVSYVIKSNVYI